MQWIKVFTDIFANPKMQLLLKERDGDTFFRIWIQLLVIAGISMQGGKIMMSENIPMTVEDLATITHKSNKKIQNILDKLIHFEMLICEDNIYKIKNWEKYQSADKLEEIRLQNCLRQQKYREKKKSETEESNVTVTQRNTKEEKKIRNKIKKEKIEDEQAVKQALRDEIKNVLEEVDNTLKLETTPSVILVVGVNGVGKTTSIGKIANRLKQDDKKVVVAAADTFRAAAVEQLEIWANRAGCDIVKREEGTDPAAVVYDAVKIAKEKQADVLICDTAGRLHNKKYLMDELVKIKKVIDKELPEASKEVLMVLDATTGQNAISQVTAFKETVNITGLVLTKLDGTAKGGVVIGIVAENKVPVKFIGIGEQIDDMEIFNSNDFVNALI